MFYQIRANEVSTRETGKRVAHKYDIHPRSLLYHSLTLPHSDQTALAGCYLNEQADLFLDVFRF